MKNRSGFLKILPWLVLAAAWLLSVGAYALYGAHNLDADISSEMVLADLLNEEGGFLSSSWYYSTELRVVSPVPVYQLGLLLFGCWHVAHTFAIALLLLGVAASFLYLARGAGMGDGAVYCAAAMLLPVSESYAFLFVYGGFYTVYFMLACWLMGLALRLQQRRHLLRRLILLGVLSVWAGMAGVRILMICGVPLVLACAIEWFGQVRMCEGRKALCASAQTPMLGGALVALAGMGIGYAVNARILSGLYHFSGYGDEQMSSFGLGRLVEQFESLFAFFGYRSEVPVFSAAGIGGLAAVCLVFALCAALYGLFRMRSALSSRERMIPLFAVCAVGVGMLLNGTTNRGGSAYTVAYYIAGVLLVVASAFLLLEKLPCRLPALRSALMMALVIAFAMPAAGYLTAVFRKTPAEYEQAAAWLADHGHTQGYATFWNGNVLTEASDGQIEVITYDSWQSTRPGDWLQKTSYRQELPDGPVFVYVTNDEMEGNVPCAQEAHLAYRTEGGAIYLYDSAFEVDQLQRGQPMLPEEGEEEAR